MEIKPVAKIYTPFPTKFGIPRQSGLTETVAKIVFEKEYRVKEAVRGLEDYSHLWLIWEFSEMKNDGWSPTVRPPRLGGNRRMGVFATRSPNRPNPLALSCVKLERVDLDGAEAPVLYVSGADILDGTPVYDIKPYLPYADAVPDARGGFADAVLGQSLAVSIPEDIKAVLGGRADALAEILSQDPRPHYQTDESRVYSFEFDGLHIEFICRDGTAEVQKVTEIQR